ncbi:MAG: AAA family ATPase [Pirellulales bacterium]
MLAKPELVQEFKTAIHLAKQIRQNPKMARIFCIANQKGGVGKTTTAVNLSVGLAKAGQRTLLIDLDPQCNATSGVGLRPAEKHPLLLEKPLHESLLDTAWDRLKLLPGSRSFVDVDRLESEAGDAAQLRQHLDACISSFDFVLIDCPPSLGQLTQAALSASTEVLMPIQCEFYAMEGLTQMIHVIRDVMQRVDGRLTFGGIVLTMYDPTLELTHEVDAEVREFFGDMHLRYCYSSRCLCGRGAPAVASVMDALRDLEVLERI